MFIFAHYNRTDSVKNVVFDMMECDVLNLCKRIDFATKYVVETLVSACQKGKEAYRGARFIATRIQFLRFFFLILY